MGKGRVKVLIS